MSVFSEIAIKALNDYKAILRRLPTSERASKLKSLRLKRQDLKEANDAALYAKAAQVLRDIETSIDHSDSAPSWYCGLHEFYKFLKALLADYYVDKNTVFHVTQQSSRALVEAIQLMALPNTQLDDQIATKLDHCERTVAKFGSKEQQSKLANALKLHRERNSTFFLPLISSFERYLTQ